MKKLLSALMLFVLGMPAFSQVSSYDEMKLTMDSSTTAYTPTKKNYVYLKSKRGTDGLNRTSSADSILNFQVNQIVLVFTETDGSAINTREEANRERWENLIMTYPEYFQTKTTYKSLCQCNTEGDAEAFKQAQGFYVYYKGEDPTPVAKKTEEKKPEEKKKEEKKQEEKPVAAKAPKAPEKEIAMVDPPKPAKTKEAPVKEKEPVKEPEAPAPVTKASSQEDNSGSEEVSENTKKKPGAVKARRTKDPKACRPACYEGGDEDLIAFFKNAIPLTKKQKKHAKNFNVMVKLMLDLDGSIKKALVTGAEEDDNAMVNTALKTMNNWNAAVKNGVTVKSDVRFILKFDSEAKCIRPYDIMANPRPGPKCKCASDDELFGS